MKRSTRDPDSSHYRLGPRILYMGGIATSQARLPEISAPIIRRATDLCDELVAIEMLDKTHTSVVARSEPRTIAGDHLWIGWRFEVQASSAEKVLLATPRRSCCRSCLVTPDSGTLPVPSRTSRNSEWRLQSAVSKALRSTMRSRDLVALGPRPRSEIRQNEL